MTDKTAKSDGKRGLTGKPHYHPVFSSIEPPRQLGSLERLIQRLTALMFPWHSHDYPGRNAALAQSMGYSVHSIEGAMKGRLSLPMALRGEKFCRDMASELLGLADQFKSEAETLAVKKAPKHRGFLTVRVRDETGIPRNARWISGRRPKPKADQSKPF